MVDLFLSLKAYGFPELGGKLCADARRQAWACVAREPNSADAHLELGQVLHTLGALEAARTELQRALELDPEGVAGRIAREPLENKPE